MVVYVPDIIEANGKTIRENNLAMKHTIPLGALVEVNIDDNRLHGLRMFVVEYSRDCDGEPLYCLGADPDLIEKINGDDEGINLIWRMKLTAGFSADCLVVIRES